MNDRVYADSPVWINIDHGVSGCPRVYVGIPELERISNSRGDL